MNRDNISNIGASNKIETEYRWSVMQAALHSNAARQYKKSGGKDKVEEHYRISRKHQKRLEEIEILRPTLQRAVHDSALLLARQMVEWGEHAKLPTVFIPYAEGKKICRTCGWLHTKDDMGASCTFIGNSHQDKYAYYNCQCGSTLVTKNEPKAGTSSGSEEGSLAPSMLKHKQPAIQQKR